MRPQTTDRRAALMRSLGAGRSAVVATDVGSSTGHQLPDTFNPVDDPDDLREVLRELAAHPDLAHLRLETSSAGAVGLRVEKDADTDPADGVLVATLEDKLCRCLTAGDVDGDGRKEMVAAAHKSGLWLLEPGSDPHDAWAITSIDRNSGGFEHAAILTDLDGDGIDELYVANDNAGEINRYVWQDGSPVKETLYTYPEGLSGFTWNIMPVPVELMPGAEGD